MLKMFAWICSGLLDIRAGVRHYALIRRLSWLDISQRYRHSVLGPFWLTLSMGIMIACIGLVFSQVFHTPIQVFLPFVAIGIMVWGFINSTLTENSVAFIAAEGMIKQLPLPLVIHVFRVIGRNTLIAGHHLILLPIIFLAVSCPISHLAWLSLPGFVILLLNLGWVSLILAVICTRYRDFPPMLNSLLQVAFYVTPILWMPELVIGKRMTYFVNLNPLYHSIELVRAPLMGKWPDVQALWCMLLLACIGWGFACMVYGRYRHRIVYWL